MDTSKRASKSQVMYDPMIISRVKQYLEENVHQTYVDVGTMAKLLQERYREYSRRKSAPFRQLVEQAYKTVLRSYGLDSNPSSDDNDDISSDLEMLEERPDLMNNMMTNMYMKKPGSGSTASATTSSNANQELIDISSDESDTENGPKKAASKSKEPVVQIGHVTIQKVAPAEQSQSGSVLFSTNAIGKSSKPFETVAEPSGQVVASFSRDPKRRKVHEDEGPPLKRVTDSNESAASSNVMRPAKIGSRRESQATTLAATGTSSSKLNKKTKREFAVQRSALKFKDVGGLYRVLNEIWDLFVHIKNPKVYRHIGLPPPRGFLLHGPPGCGKTLLAQAIAGQLEIEIIQVAATELVGGVSGESEERIRELFEQAATAAPCVLFIDEIDAISSNRQNAQKDMERRIVSQLLISLDGLTKHPNGDQVLIIGATSRPDSLDPALRRVGRFDQEISLGIPDRKAREDILSVVCTDLVLSRPFNFDAIAALTPGYVGADLLALATRAASLAVKRALRSKEERIQRATAAIEALEQLDFYELAKESTDAKVTTIDLDDTEETPVKDPTADDPPPPADSAANGNVEVAVDKKVDADAVESMVVDGDDTTVKDDGKQVECTMSEAPAADVAAPEKEPSPEKEACAVETPTETTAAAETVATSETVPENKIEDSTAIDADKPEEPVTEPVDKTVDSDVEMTFVLEDKPTPITNGDIVDLSNDDQCDAPAVKPQTGVARWLRPNEPLLSDDDFRHICITMDDFTEAVKLVQPSAKREGFITVPDVTWDDIGSLHDIREELQLAVLAPVKYPQAMLDLGLQSPSGVLLCGPPGCGKTLLAKAVANEAGVNFISVKGPELLNMYVGESERAVRQCFQRARNSAPCVIFFDEFDALCPARSGSSENTSSSRVVNQLLTEMDGVEDRKGVFLLAATNRPDIVDPAVLRPGRLDKILYVGLPGVKDRAEILQASTKKKPLLAADVSVDELATLTDNYTGADLAGLVRQAALLALKAFIASPTASSTTETALTVKRDDFLKALTHIRPSVSDEDKKHYAKLQKKYTVTASSAQ